KKITVQSEHFLLETAGPFHWLRLLPGGVPCRLASADEPEAYKVLHWDVNSPRALVFREEFSFKRLVAQDGTDYTEEAKALLPVEIQSQYTLQTDPLTRRFGRQTISNGACLLTSPGQITAIMGASGAGKTVFLKMLCGYDQPTAVRWPDGTVRPGRILVCGQTGDAAMGLLGYVPQGDAMYPELTTRESLRYRLLLKFGRLLSERDVQRIVEHVCGDLLKLSVWDSLKATGKKATIDKKIGQMDWLGEYPSGGERRRINIAHELVLEPRVLVLDEPTSGLSSKDSDDLMHVLAALARDKEMTIVMTIHQPSREMFEQIDDLLLLTRGGRPAYYGRRDYAVPFLRTVLRQRWGEICEKDNPAEEILIYLDRQEAPEVFPDAFAATMNAMGGVKMEDWAQ
ncbi:MAG: ATP-binding cassette domain-containing protein, partial [Victivallales bacterium]|nr:ATP-binding cassette domain-containing protein [Victivallales bacterium]